MAASLDHWKKGRGKLGPLQPLLGGWSASADSPMGPLTCTREFATTLGGKYVRLDAHWEFADRAYDEVAYFGIDREGTLCFWSFTSDGKQSSGRLVEASDVHPQAVAFEAEMPAGTARQVYWPEQEGFSWAVESRTKKGWNRFVQHRYRRV